jgi:hypothetical protein
MLLIGQKMLAGRSTESRNPLMVERPQLLGQQEIRETVDRVQGCPQLVGHVGEELVLELGGALELAILGGERGLLALAFLEHMGAIDPDHGLVGKGLEQADIAVVEWPVIAAAEHRQHSNHDAGRTERHSRHGPKGESGDPEVAGVGLEVGRGERLLVADHPPQHGTVRGDQPSPRDGRDSAGSVHADEPPLLDHQPDQRAIAIQQLGARLRDAVEHLGEVGAGDHVAGHPPEAGEQLIALREPLLRREEPGARDAPEPVGAANRQKDGEHPSGQQRPADTPALAREPRAYHRQAGGQDQAGRDEGRACAGVGGLQWHIRHGPKYGTTPRRTRYSVSSSVKTVSPVASIRRR